MHFHDWQRLYFDSYFTEVDFWGSNWQEVIAGDVGNDSRQRDGKILLSESMTSSLTLYNNITGLQWVIFDGILSKL